MGKIRERITPAAHAAYYHSDKLQAGFRRIKNAGGNCNDGKLYDDERSGIVQ